MSRIKLAVAAAIKAKRTWDRIPPEQRKKIVDTAAGTVRKHGPVVAKKVAETAKAQGPTVAKKVGDTARTHGPVLARRLAEALERARKRP